MNNVFTRLDKRGKIMTIVTIVMTCLAAVIATFDSRFAWLYVVVASFTWYAMARAHASYEALLDAKKQLADLREMQSQLEATLPSAPMEDA